ncbi:MAG: hypothetical protein EZS26_003344 [Candidatus Ordinivivax streblomastigis]|uniref:Uncharacterized protein n=1 Tax=Candidatus Ordinivivax streblomastigis TaxID=2540710 RepID=A0A5M8NYB8_9BACT|nr:MAG: hypothetical protein EZS26_003344 [Candidatus Ordinivivax streblomastigis]
MNILSDYFDYIRIALITMIIAIFAIALPLLLQTISRIDNKYSSTKPIETLKKTQYVSVYRNILIVAISASIL